jgi:pilus assembly protein CpaB
VDRLRGSGRLIAMVAAVLLAAVAAVALFVYVRDIEQRAFEDAELVEVLIAPEGIPEGVLGADAAEAALIERSQVPRVNVPEGAVRSLDQISGQVTLAPFFADEILVEGRFTEMGEVAPTLDIPDGLEAITVQVGVPQGVAGFVRPGDRVSLIATLEAAGEDADDDDVPVVQRSEYLLQDIPVLSTGQRVGDGADDVEEGTGQVLLTVALPPEDAERLVFAINQASLYFTLLPEDADPEDTDGVTLDELFP